MSKNKVRVTPAGVKCRTCGQKMAYVELGMCTDCYEKLVLLYHEGCVKDSKRLLHAARAHEEQQDANRSV